jgi:hypothetical protein
MLNSEKNQDRPDEIEKLDRDEENPQRDAAIDRFPGETGAVMSCEHFKK